MPKVMASGSSGGRNQRGRRVSPTLSEINIIPLVDVMLVLLIIFMVAAPMLQRGVDVRLPIASRSQEIASERLFLTVPASFGADRFVYLNDERIRMDVLSERVRQATLTSSDKQVFLRGDGTLQYQDLMQVIDALRAAGVQNVGMVTRLPGEQ